MMLQLLLLTLMLLLLQKLMLLRKQRRKPRKKVQKNLIPKIRAPKLLLLKRLPTTNCCGNEFRKGRPEKAGPFCFVAGCLRFSIR